MKLKTYTAETMAQALAQVRKDLGKDAMILHTRSYRVGAWFGLGGKNMVEITASSPTAQSGKARAPRALPRVAPAQEPKVQTEHQAEPQPEIPALREPEIVVQRGRTVTRQRLVPAVAGANGAHGPTHHADSGSDDRRNDRQSRGLDGRDALFSDQSRSSEKPSRVTPQTPLSSRAQGRQEPRADSARLADHPLVTVMASQTTLPKRPESQPKDAPSARSPQPLEPQSKPQAEPQPESRTPQPEAIHAPTPAPTPEPKPAPAASPTPVDAESGGQTNAQLRAQINTLQKMMGQVLESTRKTAVAVGTNNPSAAMPTGEMPPPLFALYTKMLDNDVPVELADRMTGSVRDRLDSVELRDEVVVRQALLREIEGTIRTRSESLLTLDHKSSASGRPRVIALVGPTGVGKTTTVAKLAATYKLRHQKKVGLITSDTYRIAAVEQLKTYAGIIGLPLKVANTPEEMAQAVEELGDCDIVVVDTAGRSQHDQRRLDELARFAAAAGPDETHLVLSTTVGDNVLRKTAERFKALGPDRCILTKLDEAVTTGPIAGLCDRIGLPLSFVTVGQEVPDDLEPARVDRLARCVLDGPEAVVRRWKEEIG